MRSAVTICLVPEARQGPFVFHGTVAEGGLAAGCRVAAELGFEGVEIFPESAAAFPVAHLPRLLADHGLALAAAIRHVPGNAAFSPDVRQLLHVSFKVAAKQGTRYTDLLVANRGVVAKQVTENIYDRHLKPLFVPAGSAS